MPQQAPRILLLTFLLLNLAPGASSAPDTPPEDDLDAPRPVKGEPGSATLRFAAKELGSSRRTPGGAAPDRPASGIVGVMSREKREIEEMTTASSSGTPGSDPHARLVVTATPRLVRNPQNHTGRVTLTPRVDAWENDGGKKYAGALDADQAALMARLGAWRQDLTREQLDALDAGQPVEISVEQPFQKLKYLGGGSLKVALRQPPKPKLKDIRILASKGGALTVGRPAVVEVEFDPAYESPGCRVTVSAGNRPLVLAARNTGNGVLFRTDPFLPWPAGLEDDGIDAPPASEGPAPASPAPGSGPTDLAGKEDPSPAPTAGSRPAAPARPRTREAAAPVPAPGSPTSQRSQLLEALDPDHTKSGKLPDSAITSQAVQPKETPAR